MRWEHRSRPYRMSRACGALPILVCSFSSSTSASRTFSMPMLAHAAANLLCAYFGGGPMFRHPSSQIADLDSNFFCTSTALRRSPVRQLRSVDIDGSSLAEIWFEDVHQRADLFLVGLALLERLQ